MTSGWQVGIDIGGTFTDVVVYQPRSGEVRAAKVASRPDDPVAGLLSALDAVGLGWDDADDLVHGTTLVTNAIVEGRFAETALVTTEGFSDTLAIGRQNRRDLYRLDWPPKASPLVPDSLRFEARERLDHKGQTLVALTEDEIEKIVRRVAESGAAAVAVCLLHAYANSGHEDELGRRLSGVVSHVALSNRISPEAREFERMATTVLNACLMPLAAKFLDRLQAAKPDKVRLHLFHSAGGMATPEALRELPLGLARSGPAAGVAAAAWVASELGIDAGISFDMGGTTSDICLIVNGQAEIRSDRGLDDRPVRLPMVAVESIGAGGGSIARLDAGALRVGPESAGADPGPACYGRGGGLPTVTDANFVLGYLDADRLAGGSIQIDRGASEQALSRLASETKTELPELALGIVRVVNASMVRALRRVTVERGIDGRQCTLLAFGGAGPMHAVEVARAFGMKRIVVPTYSSVFSAVGCVTAEMSYTQQRTLHMASTDWNQCRLDAMRADLERRLTESFDAASNPCRAEAVALVRYSGQSYSIEIFDPALDSKDALGNQFRARHAALYGFATDEPWELVALRVRVIASRGDRLPTTNSSDAGTPAARQTGTCWFDGYGAVETPRIDRESLNSGHRILGPAIIEDAWSTIVLPPGSALAVDTARHLHINPRVAA